MIRIYNPKIITGLIVFDSENKKHYEYFDAEKEWIFQFYTNPELDCEDSVKALLSKIGMDLKTYHFMDNHYFLQGKFTSNSILTMAKNDPYMFFQMVENYLQDKIKNLN